MKPTTLACALSLVLGTIALADTPPGYNPYSWQPAMGYGVSPTSQAIPSEGIFTQTAWVRDLDEYQRLADGAIVQLKNSGIGISYRITSGSVMNVLNQYDDATGIRSLTFTIKAITVAPDQVVYAYDRYVAVDTGTDLVVLDRNGDEMTVLVTITGPKSTGGGGQ